MTRRQQRLYAIGLMLLGVGVAVALALFAMRNSVTYFYTPSDIVGPHAKTIAPGHSFRLGGLVKKGSIRHLGSTIDFTVVDNTESINVAYGGIVPDLFRENSGVVATGHLNKNGTFTATQLLAKHDANYMPPALAKALKNKTPHGGPAP